MTNFITDTLRAAGALLRPVSKEKRLQAAFLRSHKKLRDKLMAAINNEYPADFSKAYYDALDNLPGRDIRGLAAIYSAVDYALTRGLDNGQLKTFVEIFRDISQDTGIERVDPTILFRAANMFRGRDTVEDFWCLRKYETAAAGMSHTRYQKALHGLLGVMLRPSGIPAKRPDIRPAA